MVTLASDVEDFIPILAISGGIVVMIISIVGGIIRKTLATRSREQSRREIAAYVAEGSMSAEEGERLLRAGLNDRGGGGCC